MVEFVTTPTDEWLKQELQRCTSSLLVSSPYVGEWLARLNSTLPHNTQRLLLTRADIRDFASGSSDLDALCRIASEGTEIITSHRLHAKVYVIDERCGLVTSANATNSGMRNNLECGVVLRDLQSVRTAADLIRGSFGAKETPQTWTTRDLEALREPVRLLKAELSSQLVAGNSDTRLLPNVDPERPVGRALRVHLAGWTQLALEGVQMQHGTTFTLNSFVVACAPLAASRYPKNNNVRAKLRQQLQRLRDLGIIEFLGDGVYRRCA